MKNRLAMPPARFVAMLFALTAFAAVSGLAFAMWIRHGAQIFYVMAASGLSWCF